MKTQNSTQWSNLYSNELSFKLTIYSSLLPLIIIVSIVYLLTVALASILLFELNPPLVQFFFVMAIMLFIVVIGLCGSRFSKVREQNRYFVKELTLLPNGVVEIGSKQHQMHLNSRIGFLGCWLCLTSKQEIKRGVKTLFIFKNSVSDESYSRLCRIIKRNTFDHSAS